MNECNTECSEDLLSDYSALAVNAIPTDVEKWFQKLWFTNKSLSTYSSNFRLYYYRERNIQYDPPNFH